MTPAASLHVVPRPRPSPTTLAEAVEFYTGYGLAVTPVRPGAKGGYKKGWSRRAAGAALVDFRADDNIGVLNGCEPKPGWHFCDIDIDANSDTARAIVAALLPPTGWWYGRASKPRSHANYLVHGALESRKLDGVDGRCILELRSATKKGTYSLSVAPGSVWTDGASREPIRFIEQRGEIGLVEDADAFARRVQLAAAGIVVAQAWPRATGHRHDLRLAFAKVLLENGLSSDETCAVLQAVMRATGSDVDDVADAVRDTAQKHAAGEPTAGAATILDALADDGRAALAALRRILPSAPVDVGAGVVMVGGDLSSIVDRVEALLCDRAIFQRGGGLVRPVRLDRARGDDIEVRRDAGATVLVDVRETWLCEEMGGVVRWFRPTAKGHAPADPAPVYARTLLARGEWRFPVLRGIVTAPTLAADGRIIQTPGYDADSGLLLEFAPGTFAPVPEHPTQDEARAALERLQRPLRAFPFVDDGAKSVALSAILTALVRGSLRTSPLHAFDAPAAGTGKSLLAELPGIIATGLQPPALSQGKSEEEDEKRLSTVLFAGDPTIHLDNCERPLSGDFLCSMLTQETVQARVLGQSERRILPSTALVLASGNNLQFAGDTARRGVVCRLDAALERPEERIFDFDCHAEARADRAALVVAGLTVLRAYHLAGRPAKLVAPMGSFSDWEWVRGALVWLGHEDPAATRAAIVDNDPRKNDLVEVMDLWAAAIDGLSRDGFVELANIGACSEDGDTAVHRLRERLVEVCCRGKWSGTSVGRWLMRHKDRVVAGRSFVCGEPGGRNHVRMWKLVERDAKAPRLPGIP